VLEAEQAQREGTSSQRQVAEKLQVPRSTLQDWMAATHPEGVEEQWRIFLESPAGVAFQHRLVLAALVVLVLMGGLGVSMVALLFNLSGLSKWVACSETHLRRQVARLQKEAIAWSEAQEEVLAPLMPERQISLALDETFKKDLMLVGLELVSGFLLVQARSTLRDAKTWGDALEQRLAKMKVKILQVVGDEAKGLIALAVKVLGVHKVSDLFHGQYELCRTLLAALRGKVQAVYQARKQAKADLERLRKDHLQWEAEKKHRPGRPLDWEGREARAIARVGQLEAELHLLEEQQGGARRAMADLGQELHPVRVLPPAAGDPPQGPLQTPEQVGERLEGVFSELWQRFVECNLGDRARAGLEKAHRLVSSWVATVRWWHGQVDRRLAEAKLPPEQSKLVREVLLPVRYLQREHARASTRPLRVALRAQIAQLCAPLRAEGSLWRTLSAETRSSLAQLAQQCVDLFQRASSAVEGWNGYLSLRHHSLHQLSEATLKTLVVLHNYVLRRPDGTTAAERFFGQKHGDLFEHLVKVMPLPARPRKRKHKKVVDPLDLAA
jgi:hypothetical protein